MIIQATIAALLAAASAAPHLEATLSNNSTTIRNNLPQGYGTDPGQRSDMTLIYDSQYDCSTFGSGQAFTNGFPAEAGLDWDIPVTGSKFTWFAVTEGQSQGILDVSIGDDCSQWVRQFRGGDLQEGICHQVIGNCLHYWH